MSIGPVEVAPVDPSSAPTPEGIATEVSLRAFAFANVTTMFILTGATASLYGPLLIRFSQKFDLSLPSAGVVLSVHFVGALCGVPLGWMAVRHFPGKIVISVTLLCLVAGGAGAALSSSWTLFL